jgi:hypothetical protein
LPADDATHTGFERLGDAASDTNGMVFLFRSLMAGTWTSCLVQIISVTNVDTLDPVGFVDVQPMVHQIDGVGQITEHGVIHNLPYFRLQGGKNAVIIDPKVGDIGVAIFAMRDISSIKTSKAVGAPGSFRRNDPADGLYIGGFLNGIPQQYVLFSDVDGITVLSPTRITLQAPDIQFVGPTHTTGAVTGDDTATYNGEVTANGGHTVSQHTHTQPADSHGDSEQPTNTPTG